MGKGRADISCGRPGYNLNIRVLKLGNLNVNGIVNGRSLFTSADAISESVSGGGCKWVCAMGDGRCESSSSQGQSRPVYNVDLKIEFVWSRVG